MVSTPRIAVAAPVHHATGSRKRALGYATLAGLAEPVEFPRCGFRVGVGPAIGTRVELQPIGTDLGGDLGLSGLFQPVPSRHRQEGLDVFSISHGCLTNVNLCR